MKALIVDDDLDLVDLLSYALRRAGYNVVAATDGDRALERWASENPDIVLLDANLPKRDGFEICRKIRQAGDTAIIMLTGRTGEADVLRGLGAGADDYVTKPFSARQLLLRMEAVLRRRGMAAGSSARLINVGDLEIDLDAHEVRVGTRPVHVTPLEFKILTSLALQPGRVLPSNELADAAWGPGNGDPSLLKSHICHLRRKLGIGNGTPGGIQTVTGVGYRLVAQAAGTPASPNGR